MKRIIEQKLLYLKKDLETINKAQKTKQLNHHLEIEVKDEIYEELKRYV